MFKILNIVDLLKYAGRNADEIKLFLSSLKKSEGEEIVTDFSP